MDDAMVTRLQVLLDREEIIDCLRRYTRGMDRADLQLLESAYHEDALICFGEDIKTRQQLVDYARSQKDQREACEHYTTNHEIEIDGDNAHVETYYFAIMKLTEGSRPAIPDYDAAESSGNEMSIFGGRYIDRFERRNGEWKIALRWSVPEWALTGSLYMPEFVAAAGEHMGRRDRTDASYERPLVGPRS
jgi:hypothetical protein